MLNVQQYGDIRTLYTSCKQRGFVMISYYDIRAAGNAMKALQNRPLRCRKLDIHYSIPKVSLLVAIFPNSLFSLLCSWNQNIAIILRFILYLCIFYPNFSYKFLVAEILMLKCCCPTLFIAGCVISG